MAHFHNHLSLTPANHRQEPVEPGSGNEDLAHENLFPDFSSFFFCLEDDRVGDVVPWVVGVCHVLP